MSPSSSDPSKPSWKRDSSKPQLSYRNRFSIDDIFNALDSTVLRPVMALLLIPAALYRHSRSHALVPYAFPKSLRDEVHYLLFNRYKWAGWLAVFVLLRTAHRAATRYVKNNGAWQADKPNWSNEIVVITGGSAGIGRATVELLSWKHKARIAVLDLAEPTYAAPPDGAPKILYIKTDVTNKEQIAAAAKQIEEHFGAAPSIIINNAGIAGGNTILKTDVSVVEKQWRVMHLSHWLMLQQFLPALIAANHGHVVNVASSASYMPIPQLGSYAAAKASALSLHDTLHRELRSRYNAPRVRTSVVCPTRVDTSLGANMVVHSTFIKPDLHPVEVGRESHSCTSLTSSPKN